MTICIGPFKINPVNIIIKLQLRSFDKADIFKKQLKQKPSK